MDIRGIIVPLITPFAEDASIDKEIFQRLIGYRPELGCTCGLAQAIKENE